MTGDKNTDKVLLVYLSALVGIAIMLLAAAVLLALYNVGGAGKVFAIVSIVVGGLVALGPSIVRRNNKDADGA